MHEGVILVPSFFVPAEPLLRHRIISSGGPISFNCPERTYMIDFWYPYDYNFFTH
jgi:hypothetical protein